ncbi:unnamed protein product [Paramecium pentaurelia]|uniref:MORN repeat protein n=1 Tax=Paramecium pentaurelia TaxID=43138 RepID=A0A8S1XXU9_9CILI|nr:unnamed protein product [Paramecium pentaurelia]
MGTVCKTIHKTQIVETDGFVLEQPIETKPFEIKSNLPEVQEMCATKIQALYRGHSVRKQNKEVEESFPPLQDVALPIEQVPEIYHHAVSKVLLQLGPFDYSKCSTMVGAKTLPPYQFLDKGGIYIGQWKNHQRNGKGKYIFPDGSLYEGYWVDDKANGYGRLIVNSGDYYEGEWKNDKNDGYGVYVHFDKSRYEGFWKDDNRHGQGTETWADNSAVYDGSFYMGVKEGYGIYKWADGSNYAGGFRNNQFQGQGVYIWPDGSKYEGYWQNNKMNGQGEMIWIDGRKYIVIRTTKRMVMGNSIGLMVEFIKVNGKMGCNMEKESTQIKMVKKFQESGLKGKGDDLFCITQSSLTYTNQIYK